MLITHETDVLISLRFVAWKHALKLTHVECIRTKQNGGRKIMALTTAHAAQAAIVLSRCVLAVLNGWRKKAPKRHIVRSSRPGAAIFLFSLVTGNLFLVTCYWVLVPGFL